MNEPNWQKIKKVFYQTLDLPLSEREDFLKNCNETVRLEVLELLKSHQEADNFISEPAFFEFGLGEVPLIGKQLGEYKILNEIGSGGMGKVYLAQREGFEQKFALKLIKRGMDSEAVLKRFVRERQILSRLEHPNIARLLNVGSTPEGLPFFVMEYIEGKPITKFCEMNGLSEKDRLVIFQNVCKAVSYAHQNLVVHRDIKPSNILVSSDGIPKLLDFGIAKLLNEEDGEATATQARILTPEYASPEQLQNMPITTATDIYSLGIVLYELLSGQRPSTPSSKRSGNKSTAKNKKETQAVINPDAKISNPKSLTGDLANIVQKSLREEPERRYQSVQEFSEDIRRFLIGLPVTATADSTYYRFAKFIQRHRQGAIMGSLAGLLLLSISGIAIWQGIAATLERAKSERRFEQVRKLANIVLFEYHDGIAQLPGATAMREKMVKDSLEFLDNLSAESNDNIELQRDIVKAYLKVGDIQGDGNTGNVGKTNESLQSYQKAFAIQEKIAALDTANIQDQKLLGDLLIEIGSQQQNLGELKNTEINFQKALIIYTNLQTKSPNDFKIRGAVAKSFWNIAQLKTSQNNFEKGLEYYQKAVDIYQQLANDDESYKKGHLRNIALTNKYMGSIWQQRGEPEKALQYFQKSLEIDLEKAKNNPNDVSSQFDLSFTYGSFASASRDLRNFQAALENYKKAIEIREKIYQADNKNVFAENALARGYQELGRTFLQQKNYPQAEENIAKSQLMYQKISDSDSENLVKKVSLADNSGLLGYINGLSLNLSKSNEFFSKSLAIYTDLLKKGKLSTLNQRRLASTYIDYGEVLLKNKHTAQAIEKLNKAQQLLENENVRKEANEELAKLEKLFIEVQRK